MQIMVYLEEILQRKDIFYLPRQTDCRICVTMTIVLNQCQNCISVKTVQITPIEKGVCYGFTTISIMLCENIMEPL